MKLLVILLAFGVSAAWATNKAEVTADSQMQGTAKDVETTRKIRERLTDDEKLSVRAQNITIVTAANTVTLKGEVEKQEEVERVKTIAREVAGPKKIVNEVKLKQ